MMRFRHKRTVTVMQAIDALSRLADSLNAPFSVRYHTLDDGCPCVHMIMGEADMLAWEFAMRPDGDAYVHQVMRDMHKEYGIEAEDIPAYLEELQEEFEEYVKAQSN